MHSSCLLPGLHGFYFMLEQSAITRDSNRLRLILKWIKNRTQLRVEYLFYLFCFSRNIFFIKQF